MQRPDLECPSARRARRCVLLTGVVGLLAVGLILAAARPAPPVARAARLLHIDPLTDPAMPSSSSLQPLAFLVGGRWAGTFEAPDGTARRLVRTYEWSFGRRLLVGKSFRIENEGVVQTRETIFAWSDEAGRIVFWDFIDAGGYGEGFVDVRGDALYMEARILGSEHPDWRLLLTHEHEDRHTIRVEVPGPEGWVDAGAFTYVREK